MEIRQIRYFVAIYEAGSVTKASARLLVAQSALSQQLAQLEDELGVQLFMRSPRGVSPTVLGRMFYARSLEVLHALSVAVESVRQLGRSPGGPVSVGMPEAISIVLGLPFLQSVRERFPDVHLRLTEGPGSELKDRLKEGRLDLAILFDDGAHQGLSTEPLVEELLTVVSRASAAAAGPVELARVLASPLVLPDIRDGLRTIIESAARSAGLKLSSVVCEVGSLSVIKSAVLQGLGATILPVSCVAAEIRQGVLQAREIVCPELRCTVVLCTRKDALLDPAAASVCRVAVEITRNLRASGRWGGKSAQEDKPEPG